MLILNITLSWVESGADRNLEPMHFEIMKKLIRYMTLLSQEDHEIGHVICESAEPCFRILVKNSRVLQTRNGQR